MELDFYEQKFSKTSIIVGLATGIPYLILIFLTFAKILPDYFISIGNFIMLPIMFISQHRYIPHTYNPIGKLKLDNETILIENNKSITLTENTTLRLRTIKVIYYFWIPKAYVLNLEIKTDEADEKKIIILKNKSQLNHFKIILDTWYKSGKNLKEYSQTGGRSFKLRENLKYADIQEIKNAYNIQW